MSPPTTYCKACKRDLTRHEEWQKHQWQCHPSNAIEEAWAQHAKDNFRDWKGSTYYESFGPYY